jgi:small subunit ribosomal protein S2
MPIPSNDDAIRAVRLITGRMADAVLEGVALREFAETEGENLDVEGMDLSEMTSYSASPDEEPPAPPTQSQEEASPAAGGSTAPA